MDMHKARILVMYFSAPLPPSLFKLFSFGEFISSPCVAGPLGFTQKVIQITPCSVTKEIAMKIKSLFLFAALTLPMTPSLVSAAGAPAIPMVVCHVDQDPQMLVPEYVCKWYGGRQHH